MASEKFSIEYFDELRTAKPFRPFAFKLKTGERYDVVQASSFGYSGDRIGMFPARGGFKLFLVSAIDAIIPLAQNAEVGH